MPFGRDIARAQLHRHHGHAEAVARLTWAITTRSVAVLTGEVGAGKTVSVRAALAGIDPFRYRPIYMPNPAGSAPAASASRSPSPAARSPASTPAPCSPRPPTPSLPKPPSAAGPPY